MSGANFTYDGYNRLVTSQTASETTTYSYNALGERVKKRNQHGLTTGFYYGLNGELLYEQDASGNTKVYVWLDGRPLARIDNDATIYYYHVDHLGTPQMMTNQSGTTVWKADYEPFGKANVTTTVAENNLRFPGQYFDRETGLHYNYFRDYEPSTGRYIEGDPIGLDGGLNVYAYVGGNPLRFIDPTGLYTEIIVWQPVTWGSSSFGHVSANVNGTNYSWGPGGWDTKYPNASGYADRQKGFRSGVSTVLNLTPEQEKKLIECYAKKRKDYNTFTNNCGDPHKDCLKEATGRALSDSLFPTNIGNDLLDSPYYGRSKFYDGPSRGFFDDAPWAR